MPAALTPEQKKAKILNARAADRGEIPEVVRSTTDRPVRRTRGVFNGTQGKLRVPEEARKRLAEAGWHLHIFNDDPGRIEEALTAGYEFVTQDEIGSNVTSVVSRNNTVGDKVAYLAGTTEKGEGLTAYLMKIRQEYYEEDQLQLHKRNDYVDQRIKSGKNAAAGVADDGFYGAGSSIKN
jgi:hypothetical protein